MHNASHLSYIFFVTNRNLNHKTLCRKVTVLQFCYKENEAFLPPWIFKLPISIVIVISKMRKVQMQTIIARKDVGESAWQFCKKCCCLQ
ncbi:hypothetical protein T4B_13715 [Trichinella pseudospiralis]|uniref:Uncharacterized protein n=1 Tax=Trichinella pseudospiralis TaxID=6337 RepID=A0A0V1EU45_TRIPS|nr:hypothetical protein T4A_511 [Trichinella pseudospiralis]KRZ31974.1 hypothetical protein T4B_13715 [Trichinella pseudospiralis]